MSLRHFWEWNYYHFYIDVLGKLAVLDEAGVDPQTPIVLGDFVDEMSWPRHILETGALAERNWIVPNGQPVEADEIIYCRTRQSHRTKMSFVVAQMGIDASGPARDDRVFIGRNDASNRRLLNQAEIAPLLEDRGFRVVEGLGGLSIADQIEVFANARVVVGVHGAGLANLFFRGPRPLSLLELHPAGFISSDFHLACEQYGWGYGRLAGTPVGLDLPAADFSVDPDSLLTTLDRLIEGTSSG